MFNENLWPFTKMVLYSFSFILISVGCMYVLLKKKLNLFGKIAFAFGAIYTLVFGVLFSVITISAILSSYMAPPFNLTFKDCLDSSTQLVSFLGTASIASIGIYITYNSKPRKKGKD